MDNLNNEPNATPESFDSIQRFIFNDYAIRGEVVQLQKSYAALIEGHNYPDCIKTLLAKMQTAICLITSTLKLQGSIMLQIRGQGALHYAYVNSNHLNETRGLASFEEGLSGTTLKEIVGENAIMSVTVIPDEGQQYQGIIALDKPTIAECIEEYYHQSMQIDTKIYIFADIEKAVAGGMLLQVLPSDNHKKQAEDFNHCTTLADTLTAAEVLTLDSQDVIYRLFNQDSVNIFPNEPICFKCMCSREHFHEMLSHLNPNEISEIISGPGSAEIECHCCGKKYTYNQEELLEILHEAKSHTQENN